MGDKSLERICCGDQAVVSARQTFGGCTQHVFGLRRHRPRKVGRLYQGNMAPAWPDANAFPRSRPFKAAGSSTRVDVPLLGAQGAGQTSRSRPPAATGAGVRVSATRKCRSSSSGRHCRASLLDKANGLEPVSRSPSHHRRRVFSSQDHIASSPSWGLLSLYSQLPKTGRIGGPSKRLAARDWPPTHFADSQ